MSRALQPIDKMREFLTSHGPAQVASVAPMTGQAQRRFAENAVRFALIEANKNPSLAKCDPKTVLMGLVDAARLGLEVGGPRASAYLVPFGNQATMIVGYQGLAKLVRQSGQVESLTAQVVFEQDDFELQFAPVGQVIHKPALRDRGAPVGVYATAKLKGGETLVEWLSIEDVEKVRKSSRSGGSGPWRDWWEEMARKTALRRLCKWLDTSPDVTNAMESDEAEHAAPSKSEKLAASLPPAEEPTTAELLPEGVSMEDMSDEDRRELEG